MLLNQLAGVCVDMTLFYHHSVHVCVCVSLCGPFLDTLVRIMPINKNSQLRKTFYVQPIEPQKNIQVNVHCSFNKSLAA